MTEVMQLILGVTDRRVTYTRFTGHLHQILLHLSLNQRDTLTKKSNTSHIFTYLIGYDENLHGLRLVSFD